MDRIPVIGMRLSGRCITRKEIEGLYPDTITRAPPTHDYPDAAWTYAASRDPRATAFFINHHSGCMTAVRMHAGGTRD